MKPVEIEFLLRDNLSGGVRKVNDVMAKLRSQLGLMEKQLDSLGVDETTKKFVLLAHTIEELEREVQGATKGVADALVGNDQGKIDAAKESLTALTGALVNAKGELQQLSVGVDSGSESMRVGGKSLERYLQLLSHLPGPLGGFGRSLQSLVGQVRSVTSAVEGMSAATEGAEAAAVGLTGATVSYIALPLLAFLAGAAASYAAVKTWMDRTAEGQDALNVATARYENVLENLKDRVSDVGEFIFRTFDQVTEKIETMVGGLENLLGMAGRLAGSSLGIPFGGQIGEAIGRDLARNDAESVELANRENRLRQKRIRFIGEEAELHEKINRYQLEAYDMSLSQEKRAKAMRNAEAAVNQLYDKRVELAKEEAEITKKQHSLHDSNYDAYEEDARLGSEVKRLNAERDMQLRSILRRTNQIERPVVKTGDGDRLLKERTKYDAIISLQERDRQRSVRDLELSTAQAEIDAMEDGREKTLAQIALDFEKKNEEIKRGYEDLRQNKIDEARKLWEADPNNKGKAFDVSSVDVTYTEEEEKHYKALMEANRAERARHQKEQADLEAQAMRDYLQEYGTYQQRKLAIAEEYAEKIRKAQTEGERASLKAEMEAKLKCLDFAKLQDSIDWESVFNHISSMSVSSLRDLKERLREALDANDITVENAKILSEKIREVEDAITDKSDVWASVLPGLRKRKRLTEQVLEAERNIAKAQSEQVAKETTARLKQGDVQGILQAKGVKVSLDGVSEMSKDEYLKALGLDPLADASSAAAKAFDEMAVATTEAAVAAEGLSKAQKRLEAANDLLKGKSSLTDVFSWASGDPMEIVNGINANVQSLDGLMGTIGVADTEFGESVHAFAEGTNSFVGAIQSLASGDVFGAVNGVVEGFRSWGKALDVGGWASGNEAEVAQTIGRLTERNELLQTAIEDLTDEMRTTRGASAIDASRRAQRLQEETNENYKEMAQAQAGYHSAHHSFNHYWGGYSQEQVNRLSGQIGRQWDGDLWSLSPEEMKMLRSNVDMWEQILKTGKGGYGERVAEKLDEYIEQAGKQDEIKDALYENLTTTTRENVFDDFLGSLYSLADGSEDVMDDIAENWQKMVNRMAVNNLVGAKFQQQLDGWYEELAKLNEARTNGEITDVEYRKRLDVLKGEYEGYVESAKRDIETLRDEGIIKATGDEGVTQSGKSGAFTAMSQEQGTKLEGLFVSGQMHWSSMDDKLTDVSRQLGEAGDSLRQIAENTGSSAQSLGEIKEEFKKMVRDGLKVK